MGAIGYTSQNAATGNRRYAPRTEIFLRGINEGSLVNKPYVVIKNVSQSGCLISTSEPLAEGDTVTVSFPNGRSFTAGVAWADGLEAGCSFAKPLSRGDYASALLAADPARPQSLSVENKGIVSTRTHHSAEYRRWPRVVRAAVLGGLSVSLWAVIGIAIF